MTPFFQTSKMTAKFSFVLITYKPGPAATADVYEQWLRREDNPLFNSIAGIDEYSNWKVLAPDGLDFTHFDLLGLESPADLEHVWFNERLDEFRRKWVVRWGYDSASLPASSFAVLCLSDHGRLRAKHSFLQMCFDPKGSQSCDRWQIAETLRKHWAIGRAPSSGSWRSPISEFSPLGCRVLGLSFQQQPPPKSDSSGRCILAKCIAAPHWK